MAEKILIVDDDPDTISLFNVLLTRLGYQVIIARNGMEALEFAHRDLPDLIILDIMMPGADGFDVARSLHRLPDTATIPILMVTARSTPEDKNRGYEAGADIYLTKPVGQMDLQANIKVLLQQRTARKAVASHHGYVVGVMAAKGGLGVSSVALNLAVTYASRYGGKVAAAELRPGQGTWSDELNIPAAHGLAQLLGMNSIQITPAIVESQLSNTEHKIKLLLASDLSKTPVHGTEAGQYDAIISGLSSLATLSVLDIGTYFSDALPIIINHCSEVIVVTEPQLLAVKRTARMLELLREYGVGTSKPLDILSLNHTRSDTTLTVTQIEEMLHKPVSMGIPPALELSAAAQRRCAPMVVVQPEGLVAQQFAKLAEIVKKHRESL